MKEQFCITHICKNYGEILDIIKDKRPEYYEAAISTENIKEFFCCNSFIMKKKDFFNYCEFVFDILFEFDKRNNFSSDDDVLNYVMNYYNDSNTYYYQSRLQGFISERLANIFYHKNFRTIKSFDFGSF